MNYSDKNSEFEIDSSWISIASLKKAADISTLIENFQSENTMPVNMSTASDFKSTEHMSESISYNKLHFSQVKKQLHPPYARLILKTQKLNEEIAILSLQLKLSNKKSND